jgi:hypothetical protein
MPGSDSKYKKIYVKRLPKMFANGEDVVEVCAELGICRTTFYKWVKKYPEFAEAYKNSKDIAKAWWLKLGREGACGKSDIVPAVWVFTMKAKFNYSETMNVNTNLSGGVHTTSDISEEMKKRGLPIPNIDLPDIK